MNIANQKLTKDQVRLILQLIDKGITDLKHCWETYDVEFEEEINELKDLEGVFELQYKLFEIECGFNSIRGLNSMFHDDEPPAILHLTYPGGYIRTPIIESCKMQLIRDISSLIIQQEKELKDKLDIRSIKIYPLNDQQFRIKTEHCDIILTQRVDSTVDYIDKIARKKFISKSYLDLINYIAVKEKEAQQER